MSKVNTVLTVFCLILILSTTINIKLIMLLYTQNKRVKKINSVFQERHHRILKKNCELKIQNQQISRNLQLYKEDVYYEKFKHVKRQKISDLKLQIFDLENEIEKIKKTSN